MKPEELEKLWQEDPEQDFDAFVDKYIGRDDEGFPICYKTGNGHPYCLLCKYQETC
jgi:hypothetical protein